MDSKVNTDIVAALGMCDVSSSNPRTTKGKIGRQELKRGIAWVAAKWSAAIPSVVA